jgi:tripartite-type tricarboxylate transporter receptor subunit TctC
MMSTLQKTVVIAIAFANGALIVDNVYPQSYPARPVRIIVPNGPGSSGDIVARFIAPPLSERLGQPVIVDNRAGAGTMIGGEAVAKAVPDGYTLLMGFATLAINPVMYKKLPYDALRDFAPITHLVSVPALVAVHTSLPAKSIRELIALAKARPGQIAFASSGQGTFSHVSSELLLSMANVRMLHIPYKGTAGATPLITGEASMQTSNLLTMLPHARSGRVRPLGVTSLKRATAAPDIPTVAESGLPGYESVQWLGLLAPTATPAEIINHLHKEAVAVVRTPDFKERLSKDGAETVGSSPAEFGAYIRSETAKWSKVLKAAGVEPQ